MPKGIKGFQKGHPTFISEETYKKISEKTKGRKLTEEWKTKIGLGNKNNKTGIENGVKTRFKGTGFKALKILRNKNKYRYIHYWVSKVLGKPAKCTKCGKDGLTGRKIHWANISGRYLKRKNDWVRLCVRCHFYRDGILNTNVNTFIS